MHHRKNRLLQRLDELTAELSARPDALALLALGSAGLEQERLDNYSDLDFFVLVQHHSKHAYLASLDWMTSAPIAYAFRNTIDGYKVLYEDGVFCEFAVFTPDELSGIPFSRGRLLYCHPSFDAGLVEPPKRDAPVYHQEWHVGEALTNLYIGMGRYLRGEKLAASRFIYHHALDHLLALAPHFLDATDASVDTFDPTRRLEQRFPQLAQRLPQMMGGYEQTPTAARAILAQLSDWVPVNPAIRQGILAYCDEADQKQA